jgi:nicotinamidase-related amidase
MTKGLILIDIQNDYFPGGSMELVGMEQAVENAALLLEEWRKRAFPVHHIQHISKRPGSTFFLPNTNGVEIQIGRAHV